MDEKIDIVIPWVDGGDIEWQKERNKYAGKGPEDFAVYRFRDMGLLKFLFRGIEKNMPWVNKVFFVTNGQKPEWLNTECEKLVWTKHEDFIPKEHLPTFSANPIELNLHRIKNLSENFIYFNDDTYPMLPISQDFFIKDGKPRYVAGFDTAKADGTYFQQILFNDMKLICSGFRKKQVLKKNHKKFYSSHYRFDTKFKTFCLTPFKTFSIMHVYHMPNLIKKSDMEKIWSKYSEKLSQVSSNKFRNDQDVNQYIFSWSRILTGDFEPAYEKQTKFYDLSGTPYANVINDINKHKYKIMCINDGCSLNEDYNFEESKEELTKVFEKLFPEKSKFEK